MERPCRTTLSAVTVGVSQGVEVLIEPTQVAQECCDYGTRRFGSMEPTWFRPHDVSEGHEVYASDGDSVVRGTMTSIDNDGHYVVRLDDGGSMTCVRGDMGHVTISTATPTAQTVRATAELRYDDEQNTVKLFSRSVEGRRTRLRAVRGELTPAEIAEIPAVFHLLLRHLQRPVSAETGATVLPPDYSTMAHADGTPNPVTFDDLRRKLGGIAKKNAPGYSGNGPELHAPMPDVRATDVLLLLNIIQHSGVTPHAWHVDLIHYVHKGGDDTSLPNHRLLTLVDVLRKVFSVVAISRMRRDWTTGPWPVQPRLPAAGALYSERHLPAEDGGGTVPGRRRGSGDIPTNEAPLLAGTATMMEEGLCALDPVEHAVLEGVVRDLDSRVCMVAPNSRRTDTDSSDSAATSLRLITQAARTSRNGQATVEFFVTDS